ncbi:MAG: inositol monophosphatase family protein [Gemmataceae bacterium]|nr:histidinol phosphate phosphatase [Gemmata sp.]MDW8197886.1 inositol monophosphatase family protein [Gemmataceae bacterium]
MNSDWRTRYELAVEIAHQAGDLARTYYESTFAINHKADRSPVTIADQQAEQLIRERIAAAFPDDGLLGEEFGHQPGSSGFRWIIDPIDGTKSFIRHIPLWATLIGLEYRGEQIGGVVYIPVLGMTYRALRGDGAYVNHRRIHVSTVDQLGESLLCYSSMGWFTRAGREDVFHSLYRQTQRQRGFGDFYGFVLVAEGAADIMIEHGVHPWDIAATKAIIEEAGGTFTNWSGQATIHTADVVATNGKLHADVLRILTPPPN